MRDARILSQVLEEPWAIVPAAYREVVTVALRHAAGERLSPGEILAVLGERAGPVVPAETGSAIAIIPLRGVLAPKMDLMTEYSGGTSTERFCAAYRQAVFDPNVAEIAVPIHSPGGIVFGLEEAADIIYKLRGIKPTTAVVDYEMGSGALWIGTQFERLVGSPSSQSGSLGVVTAHEDVSKMMETMGVKLTFITEPKGGYKVEGNPYEPLSEEAKEFLQEKARRYYEPFLKAVARGRKVSTTVARDKFGFGRMLSADEALEVGMIDEKATFAQVIERLMKRAQKGKSRAQDDATEMMAALAEGEGEAPEADAASAAEPVPEATAEPTSDKDTAFAKLRLSAARRRS